MTKIFKTIAQWRTFRKEPFFQNKTLGFVPTMGALHEGHTSLIKKSKTDNDLTMVSIFVNPTQFNSNSDLAKYPVSIDSDLEILNSLETDFLLYPSYNEIYPDNFNYKISESKTTNILCGKSRPGHFEGVLTVVMKLLNIADATHAYFGEKDFQQYILVKGMCDAFFVDTKIISCPIIREFDGLAMSSRNSILSKQERILAGKFPKILASSKSPDEIYMELKNSNLNPDYVTDALGRRFGAVNIGSVRLIDNVKI